MKSVFTFILAGILVGLRYAFTRSSLKGIILRSSHLRLYSTTIGPNTFSVQDTESRNLTISAVKSCIFWNDAEIKRRKEYVNVLPSSDDYYDSLKSLVQTQSRYVTDIGYYISDMNERISDVAAYNDEQIKRLNEEIEESKAMNEENRLEVQTIKAEVADDRVVMSEIRKDHQLLHQKYNQIMALLMIFFVLQLFSVSQFYILIKLFSR